MPILNYTTTIPAERTIGEITALLVRKGARTVSTDFREDGSIKAVSFVLAVGGMPVRFQLPCNVDGVAGAMLREKPHHRNHGALDQYKQRLREQAERVSWRILKDWIEAQIALIQSGQAELGQIFLPYAMQQDGRTMYELFLENNQKQLGAGGA